MTGKARMHTNAGSKMMKRRLEAIKKLVTEYNLSVDVTLVR